MPHICGKDCTLLPPVDITVERCLECRQPLVPFFIYKRYGVCPRCHLYYWHDGRRLVPLTDEQAFYLKHL